MKNRKKIGRKNQKQGTEGELLVMKNLRKNGWTVIPTPASKSPLDIIAHHKRKNLWWGIQVKSTKTGMTFNPKRLADECNNLYMTPVVGFVKVGKIRDVAFCMWKRGVFYHVLENGIDQHLLGTKWDCRYFEAKISLKI